MGQAASPIKEELAEKAMHGKHEFKASVHVQSLAGTNPNSSSSDN